MEADETSAEENSAEEIPAEGREESPENPKILSFRRQLFACASTTVGAAAAGFVAQRHRDRFEDWFLGKLGSGSYILYTPMYGDLVGIISAIPCLYFLGRRISLIISQFMFLITLLVNEYFYAAGPDQLKMDFYCLPVLHACIRVYAIVMVVYVTEITQPTLRAFFAGCFFPPFLIGMALARTVLPLKYRLPAAIVAQVISAVFAVLAPETPHWLALKDRQEAAQEVFLWLRADTDDIDEFAMISEKAAVDAQERGISKVFTLEFVVPLVKILFMYVGTDSACRVFLTHRTLPWEFFRYDCTFEHGDQPNRFPVYSTYLFPIFGSISFLFLSFEFSRRPLYLVCVGMSYVLCMCYWVEVQKTDYTYNGWLIIMSCYVSSHVGGRPILFLLPAEIFPGSVKEFGVAACELLQFSFQLMDYNYVGPLWWTNMYAVLRFIFVPFGILLTFLFMPETKDITLVETEELGPLLEMPSIIMSFTEKDSEIDDYE